MARSFTRASNHYLENANAVVSGPPLSLAAFFYTDDLTVDQTLLWVGDNTATNQYHTMIMRGATANDPLTAQTRSTSATSNASANGTSANAWQHGAAVFAAANSRKAYLNGTTTGTNSTSNTPNAPNTTAIGRRSSSSPTDYMSGRIAEAGIWNVALTDAEVVALSRGVSPLRIRPGNLVAYWPLYGNGSPEPNYGPSGVTYNMTVTGASQIDHPPVQNPFGMANGWRGAIAAAAPASITIPVLMNSYRQRRVLV